MDIQSCRYIRTIIIKYLDSQKYLMDEKVLSKYLYIINIELTEENKLDVLDFLDILPAELKEPLIEKISFAKNQGIIKR